ncbi:C-C motif chemokine 3-like [Pseudorca crassidens]|uniref:C-C motif chemokine 3-like n=1 Tax=Pseudorca crassidens TaxID=82174 RepID=UPI00352D86E7
MVNKGSHGELISDGQATLKHEKLEAGDDQIGSCRMVSCYELHMSGSDQSVLFLTVGANTPTACCFSYISWQIPCKFMDDYYETSRQCSKPSVIFQTKRGQEVCADPNEDRVQEYITDLELSA